MTPVVSDPIIAPIGTPVSADLGPDGITWAQGHPLIIDQYGKQIVIAQRASTGLRIIVNNGAGWVDLAIEINYVRRGNGVYDSTNDLLHVLLLCDNATDGILYRRYSITRDGANNIIALAQVVGINLQLDYQNSGTVSYQHPVLMLCDDIGALVALWGIYQIGGTELGTEVRGSMRVLSNTADDNIAANWRPIGTDSISSIDNDAAVPYTAVAKTGSVSIANGYPSAARKVVGTHAKDLYIAYHMGGVYYCCRLQWDPSTEDWSGTPPVVSELSALVRSGVDNGYLRKTQLLTEPREDTTNDRILVGLATWLNNVDGDSWGYVAINADDTAGAYIDTYHGVAAQCGPDIFITGDIAIDLGRVVVTYTDLPSKRAWVRCFNAAGDEIQLPLLVYNGTPVDIPTLYQVGPNARVANKLLVLFRDFNAAAVNNPPTYTPPYNGYHGTLTWLNPVAARRQTPVIPVLRQVLDASPCLGQVAV